MRLPAMLWLFTSVLGFAQTPGRPIVLQDVRLIDGTGGAPRDHMRVTISNGEITEIRSALLRIAFSAECRDLESLRQNPDARFD